jgi:hypothetical protein
MWSGECAILRLMLLIMMKFKDGAAIVGKASPLWRPRMTLKMYVIRGHFYFLKRIIIDAGAGPQFYSFSKCASSSRTGFDSPRDNQSATRKVPTTTTSMNRTTLIRRLESGLTTL